jgi:predicted RNA-binding Zn-ribbon protein involved in translation (DUF1610 family)
MSVRQGIDRGDGERAEIHLCPGCGSQLVEPTDWWQLDQSRWEVHLRCPECGWRGSGAYEQSEVDRLDAVLDEAIDAILRDLRHLTRANMEEEADQFAAALAADRILPEDF